MDEKSNRFVVKPTNIMVLESEKGTHNIRKIYFSFKDLDIWSLEFDGESIVTEVFDSRKQNPISETKEENGLVRHIMPGEVLFLPNEEVKELFITLWTKAAASKDYDKKQWMKLDRILSECGYSL
jgi:hypothetical protein